MDAVRPPNATRRIPGDERRILIPEEQRALMTPIVTSFHSRGDMECVWKYKAWGAKVEDIDT